jgi:hypothetical protein
MTVVTLLRDKIKEGIFTSKLGQNSQNFWASPFIFSAYRVMWPDFWLDAMQRRTQTVSVETVGNRNDNSWKQFSENSQYLKIKIRLKQHNFKFKKYVLQSKHIKTYYLTTPLTKQHLIPKSLYHSIADQ